MAQLAIPIAGAWLGSFWGPMGAQIGWMLGSALAPKSESMDQNKLGDLRIQTSQYNVPLPLVYGKMRVAGNIIWAADKETYSIEAEGGKGGGVSSAASGTGYYLSMAIAICQGPIKGISKVWADGELIIDCTDASKPLIGALYLGDDAQLPDPTMESHLGVDNVPAYRGIAYIVLNRFDNQSRPTPPQFSFEVIKEL